MCLLLAFNYFVSDDFLHSNLFKTIFPYCALTQNSELLQKPHLLSNQLQNFIKLS